MIKTKYFLVAAVLSAALLPLGCSSPNGKKASYPNECPYAKAEGACAKTPQCKPDPNEKFEDGKVMEPLFSKLKDTIWTPVSLANQGDLKAPTTNGKYEVYMFFDSNCRVNGKAGDNLFGGNPSITPSGNFKADKFFTTRMMGPNFKYEDAFLKTISNADFICVKGDSLKLYKDGKIAADFKKISPEQTTAKPGK